jgi:hypothetical protein
MVENQGSEALETFRRHPRRGSSRRAAYRGSGWTGFDVATYRCERIEEERKRNVYLSLS